VKRQFGMFVLLAALAPPGLAAERYTFDPTHSAPVFEFTHLGLTTQTGRFDRAGGEMVIDRAAHKGSVTYEVETASLNMGYGTETPDSAGYQLFQVGKFPKIRFNSTRLDFDAAGNVIAAAGRLTLLGVTRPLTVTVSGFKCSVAPLLKKMMCAGNISATVKRSDFGMIDYIPNISDEIRVSVPVEAYRN
jgi:polyisoprenoid-binding protein YceI